MSSRLRALACVLLTLGCGCCRSSCPPTGGAPTLVGSSAPRPVGAPSVARRPEPGKPLRVRGPGYEGVIFAAASAGESWTPSDLEVARLEASLAAAARRFMPENKTPLSEYVRQYEGTRADGRRKILVHGLHRDWLREDHRDPMLELVLVADGGTWFFEASYDPETGAFDYVQAHGEA